jgi:hypothetical protein
MPLAVLALHQASQVHLLPMQKVEMAAAVLHLRLEQAILVMVAVVVGQLFMLTLLAVLVLLFFQYQQLNTQAQPQAHQQSPQAAQIQF